MHFLAQKVAGFIFFDFLCALMRRICFLFYLFLSTVSVWAYDFAEGGIYYAVTASDEVSVKITGTTATWFKNGVQVDTGTIPSQTNNIRLVDFSQFTTTYVKVKPL